MKLNPEIEELVNKFKGGSIKYEKDKNYIEICDFYDYLYIEACFNNIYSTFSFINNKLSLHYYNGIEGIEGSEEFINDRIKNAIEQNVINIKHYLEKHGYDEEKYNNYISENLTFWKLNEFDYAEEKTIKNYEKMKNIYESKNNELYWKIDIEKYYNIFEEGYIATGESGSARFLDCIKAESFRDACNKYIEKNPNLKQLYNEEKLTIWGCRLFDNMVDARKSFG